MIQRYQFGFDFGLIFWFPVSVERFKKKVAPLLLTAGQLDGIKPEEILPFFTEDFILRDGFRLYRAIPRGKA